MQGREQIEDDCQKLDILQQKAPQRERGEWKMDDQKERLEGEPEALPAIAFGKADWKKYFGEIGDEPSLPPNIHKILSGPCCFWEEGRKVKNTHILTLIPKSVDGKSFTLNTLEELIQSPRGGGHATEYRYYTDAVRKEFGDQEVSRSYWVLMTTNVLDGSRNKSYREQLTFVKKHAERTGIPYEVPRVLEAATSILMHHAKTGKRLYEDSPLTYTRCQGLSGFKGLGVGGFSSEGLRVCRSLSVRSRGIRGVGVVRKI